MKKIIAVALALVLVFSLCGCSGGETKVWDWTRELNQEDIISVTPWRHDDEHMELENLDDEETIELVTLLNKLTKDSFTHNKHLRGGTPTYGVKLNIAGQTYHLNEANGPHGLLEISYNEKLWWIDSQELSDFIQEVTAEKDTAHGEKEVQVTCIDYPYYNGLEDLAGNADYIIHGKVIDKTYEWRVISTPAAELYLNPEDIPPWKRNHEFQSCRRL